MDLMKNLFNKGGIILSIWLIYTLFDLFGVRDMLFIHEHGLHERFIVNYIASSAAFLCLIILIKEHLMSGKTKRAVAFIILFLPLVVQLSYFGIYRKFVSAFGFSAFYEDPAMVFDLWINNLNIPKIILAFILALGSLKILKRLPGRFHWAASAISSFIIVVVTSLMVFSWYSTPVFQNSVLAYAGSFLEMAKQKSYTHYKMDKPVIQLEKTDKILPNIIYIIGESTVLSHMSLFGYERNTTPGLVKLEKARKIVTFDNCISIGLMTRLSVPYMLAGLQGIDPKGVFYTYPTIFNYAKARGYATAMITAQDLSWGNLKNILIDKDVDEFENGTNFNPGLSVHKGADDTDVLERGVMPYITKTKSPFLLVLQMDGNHYPFNQHSNKKNKIFLPETEPNCVNAFDNSVVETDLVLTKLIDEMRSKFPDSWIFFSPDHGQSLGGINGFYNDNYSSDVIHNPLIVSPPSAFVSILSENRHAPLSQSDIVPTILDLMDIKPVKPLDGYSILGKIPHDRLRVCSTYMPTFHNTPESVLVFPDLTYYFIDLDRKSVTLKDGKTTVKFDDMDKEYQDVFLRRM
ncbi:MAG: sulfatase-like hydrolase/transferase [Desulfobacteraceae bacterium]|jgi:glucan phosphoethanolaminetransferase (alkaline phosphatase superfamily)